ncbi:membrane protein [Pseudomonas cremoricolorata]|uniref:Membrane protein n=1 Tax=Pseudomonas cremoricolorata TaxID=157783 RepID=A0A089WN12_9PSED|nr:Pr6Pr family membrane protein [Pseudomonas cremoricolorata]AIR87867.1 membrane protein [Pseudomonas cremoricolorata]
MRHPWLTLAALLGWTGLSVQIWLVLIARWQAEANLVGGLVSVFGYFTVLSNTLVATVLSHAAWGREGPARRWFLSAPVSTGIAVSISLVALAYSLLLRHLWQPSGWQWLADELLHDVMPALFVLYWWRVVPKGSLRLHHLAAWSLYPLGYFAFALWRGFEIGVYPYPFINVAELGYGRVLLNALGLLLGFCLVGGLFIAIDRWRARRRA